MRTFRLVNHRSGAGSILVPYQRKDPSVAAGHLFFMTNGWFWAKLEHLMRQKRGVSLYKSKVYNSQS